MRQRERGVGVALAESRARGAEETTNAQSFDARAVVRVLGVARGERFEGAVVERVGGGEGVVRERVVRVVGEIAREVELVGEVGEDARRSSVERGVERARHGDE